MAGAKDVTVRLGEPVGDRSVVPAGRRYLIRLRIDGARTVTVEGHGPLQRLNGPSQDGAGWWEDGRGFIVVRPPAQTAVIVNVST